MRESYRGRLIRDPDQYEADYMKDLQPFYDALHARIAAADQSVQDEQANQDRLGGAYMKQNATTFAPNVGGSGLMYEDPYQRGGESQHPGTGMQSIMPLQRMGMDTVGMPYQRPEGDAGNSMMGVEKPLPSFQGPQPIPPTRSRQRMYEGMNRGNRNRSLALQPLIEYFNSQYPGAGPD